MKLVTDRDGNSYIVTPTKINGRSYLALVDTGATTVVISERVFAKLKNPKYHSCVVVTANKINRARNVEVNLEINNLEGATEALCIDLKIIRERCKRLRVPIYEVMIGIAELKDYKLQKELYKCLK